ncbi:Outer envelope protein 64, mitochondrial [Vitis vinifera]|uniref:Outer envelope protein 64, mitochondrial n=1 Tax=Vitis vinifera TaxID=29760 RepID=A0A438GNZ1_VITVI|nr:Outer envelope protein 64, mitochondrial [Vitis vinifera]
MSKALHQLKKHIDVSNPKAWIVIAAGVAGIVILVETRRRKRRAALLTREAWALSSSASSFFPSPNRLLLPLGSCSLALNLRFDVKGYVTGFGSTSWKRTHEEATKTAVAVTALLKNGATCVGKTVLDELSFGITGENMDFGSPANPVLPSHIPGGSSSGSAVAVASQLVDFAIA